MACPGSLTIVGRNDVLHIITYVLSLYLHSQDPIFAA
jgi:hypothetical protein